MSKHYNDGLRGDDQETVSFLARLAGQRDALELAGLPRRSAVLGRGSWQ
jgi:hypothetical protein